MNWPTWSSACYTGNVAMRPKTSDRWLRTVCKTSGVPYLNETVMSTTRGQLLERTSSRYAPVSPAEGLSQIENAEGSCVFIGKACDAAAVQFARKLRPAMPRFSGFGIFRFWLKNLSFKEKLSSFFDTAKRVYAKKLTRPCNVGAWMPEGRRE